MRKYTRRDILTGLASFGGLGIVHTALGRAHGSTSALGASQRITRYEIIPVRVPMHERVRDIFPAVFRKQGLNSDFYDSTLV